MRNAFSSLLIRFVSREGVRGVAGVASATPYFDWIRGFLHYANYLLINMCLCNY